MEELKQLTVLKMPDTRQSYSYRNEQISTIIDTANRKGHTYVEIELPIDKRDIPHYSTVHVNVIDRTCQLFVRVHRQWGSVQCKQLACY